MRPWWLRALLWLWTFPIPVFAALNSKRVLTVLDSGIEVAEYRWWGNGRFTVGAYPKILRPPGKGMPRPALLRHELRHITQQLWVGGIAFVVSYGLMWLVLWPIKGFDWEAAYRAIPWERDARNQE